MSTWGNPGKDCGNPDYSSPSSFSYSFSSCSFSSCSSFSSCCLSFCSSSFVSFSVFYVFQSVYTVFLYFLYSYSSSALLSFTFTNYYYVSQGYRFVPITGLSVTEKSTGTTRRYHFFTSPCLLSSFSVFLFSQLPVLYVSASLPLFLFPSQSFYFPIPFYSLPLFFCPLLTYPPPHSPTHILSLSSWPYYYPRSSPSRQVHISRSFLYPFASIIVH